MHKICPSCNKPFGPANDSPGARYRFKHKQKYCSRDCLYAGLRDDPQEVFWRRVNKSDGCWLWNGFLNHDGYGRLGPRKGQWSGYRAHRYSWELANGRKVPTGMSVMHICDVRACVRPDHLKLGTHQENMKDMERKGRSGTLGEKNLHAKLTADQVRAIRNSYVGGKGRSSNAKDIAAVFGVEVGAVHSVLRGHTWKHVK